MNVFTYTCDFILFKDSKFLLNEQITELCDCCGVTGGGDDRCVWGGVHGKDLGCRLLLSLQRMERTTQVCQKTVLCHR